MNFTWSQFIIVVSIATVLYYLVVYVIFFLRKKDLNAAIFSNTTSNNLSPKSSNKQNNKNQQSKNENNPLLYTQGFIDTKVITEDHFKTDDNFVINEVVNSDTTTENIDIQTDDLDIQYSNETLISSNSFESSTTVSNITNELTSLETGFTNDNKDTGLLNEKNLNLDGITHPSSENENKLNDLSNVYSEENIDTLAKNKNGDIDINKIPAEKVLSIEPDSLKPNEKPQQMQSLLHLVQKK